LGSSGVWRCGVQDDLHLPQFPYSKIRSSPFHVEAPLASCSSCSPAPHLRPYSSCEIHPFSSSALQVSTHTTGSAPSQTTASARTDGRRVGCVGLGWRAMSAASASLTSLLSLPRRWPCPLPTPLKQTSRTRAPIQGEMHSRRACWAGAALGATSKGVYRRPLRGDEYLESRLHEPPRPALRPCPTTILRAQVDSNTVGI